jgi:uncharacterized protein YigE (DUF2233 family)
MLRAFLLSTAVLFAMTLALKADDKEKRDKDTKKPTEATVTNVDAKKGQITLKMKDSTGKETEKTFNLTADVRMLDDKGNAVAIDVFRSGNEVLVIEREGKLAQLQKQKK